MSSVVEMLLKFKIVQLEGKLLLYESLVSEFSRMESIQQVASKAEQQMKEILKA
ncbi:MAG: hypothetical protein IMF19_11290 [Proteobacteria bacterium]|nr:hypothetical protein [Pseudomonadota bacterium]